MTGSFWKWSVYLGFALALQWPDEVMHSHAKDNEKGVPSTQVL